MFVETIYNKMPKELNDRQTHTCALHRSEAERSRAVIVVMHIIAVETYSNLFHSS